MAEYTVKELVFNHEKAFMPEKAAGLDAVIQYRLTGDQAGDYIITIKDDKCSVAEGVTDDPVMTMTADGSYFGDVLFDVTNTSCITSCAFPQLAGDLNLAMKLTSFFKMGG